jgi:hypothetical protein
MKKLKIAVIDLVTKGPTKALYARVMNPNLASIMPQIVSVWCEEAGHDVKFICYTGFEFITSFTQAAQLAYSISNMCRQRGAVTVLGGPHARCYPDDAVKYFDYVTGYTDREIISDILADGEPHRPLGVHLAADDQPTELPSVAERWKFIEPTLAKAPTIKMVPLIGSLGCPYTCSFCIDSVVDYKPLSFDQLRDDLRFLLGKMKRPRARSQLRHSLQRLHGCPGGCGSPQQHGPRCREQPVVALRITPPETPAERLQGDPPRRRVVVRLRQQIQVGCAHG